jgi:hypothetical protein
MIDKIYIMNYILSIITKKVYDNSSYLLINFFTSIYDTYDDIINSNINHINLYKYELEKTDIKNKLSIILSILKIIINKYNNISDENKMIDINDDNYDYEIIDYNNLLNDLLNNCPNILKISIVSILETINKIRLNLDIINDKINIYNKSFFKIINKINIDDNIKNIIVYNNIFDNKISLFFNLLKLYNIKIN